MRVWIVSVAVLFVLVQLYQWVKHYTFPLPIYVLGGAFLAIASNYEKGIGTFFDREPAKRDNYLSQKDTFVNDIKLPEGENIKSGLGEGKE